MIANNPGYLKEKQRAAILLIQCFFIRAFITLFVFAAFDLSVSGQIKSCAWKPTPRSLINSNNDLALRSNTPPLQKPNNSLANDTLYTLPVVVHVIHTGAAPGTGDNPSDARINAMIEGLNNAYRKAGSTFGGIDMKIQFALAKKSPECNTTSGIERINGTSVSNYASGGITNNNTNSSASEDEIKSLSRWPNTDYINIWVVNKINGGNNVAGYAYFPEYNSAITDGIVLIAPVVNGTDKTIVHEMGHYFDLYHTFYDDSTETTCAQNDDCAAKGDRICDTEPCLLEFNCSNTFDSCTHNTYVVADITHSYTVLNNYMSYSNCKWMFTQDQKNRSRDALLTFRHGLISSGALNDMPMAIPAVACVPASSNGLSPYYGVQQFDFNTLHVYSGSSDADGSHYSDRTCNQSVTIIKGQTYQLKVTGSYLNPHRIKVFIDYNNNGSFANAGETVLSSSNGEATTNITISPSFSLTHVPLRIRVIADNPELPVPDACNLHGDASFGAGEAEDYTLIIIPKQVWSVSSGEWNNPATWSCNCVPGNDDEVTIRAAHTVTLSSAAAQCGMLSLEAGSSFTCSKKLKLTGKN
ncbi:MAG: M43 family zinc metalloprotease [Ginsengibacter sp.]